MEFNDLSIESYYDKGYYFKDTKINEYGITPTCLYAPYCNAQFAQYGDLIVIKYRENDITSFALGGDLTSSNVKSVLHELYSQYGYLRIEFLSSPQKDIIISYFKDYEYEVKYDSDQFDYLYNIEDFIKLDGKKNRHKREHYNSFIQNNTFHLSQLAPSNIDDCKAITNEWCKRKDCSLCEYCCEKDVINVLLDNYDKYPAQGTILYIGDSPHAFFIYEPVGDTIMGYHQKTITDEIKGLSHAIYIETMKTLATKYKYFNIGPDIGLEGLRRFKHQFKPFFMVEKYTIVIK